MSFLRTYVKTTLGPLKIKSSFLQLKILHNLVGMRTIVQWLQKVMTFVRSNSMVGLPSYVEEEHVNNRKVEKLVAFPVTEDGNGNEYQGRHIRMIPKKTKKNTPRKIVVN